MHICCLYPIQISIYYIHKFTNSLKTLPEIKYPCQDMPLLNFPTNFKNSYHRKLTKLVS